MKLNRSVFGKSVGSGAAAFTMPELLFSVVCFSIVATGVYTGLAQGFKIVTGTQESLRATQILQEQAEVLRLYTWDQINTEGFIPTNFTRSFYLSGTQATSGLTYTGQIQIQNPALSESYSNDIKAVTVTLSWNQGNVQHQRQATTLISRYGLHNYYYHSYP